MSKRAVFLDVDGVLNDYYTKEIMNGYTFIDESKVERLARLVHTTNADVVLSSDWRYIPFTIFSGPEEDDPLPCWQAFIRVLDMYDIHLAGMTDINPENIEKKGRGEEIADYIRIHPEYTACVILDDISKMWPMGRWHIQTSRTKGLTDKQVDKAIKMFESGAAAV